MTNPGPPKTVRVAAYQAPLLPSGSDDALALVREQVSRSEAAGVEILCCPEAILGGLADYSDQPASLAIDVEGGELQARLAPLASASVTTILGFTEIDRCGRLFNAAAIFHRGAVAGLYRKLHPAINRSVYHAGDATPVFTVGALTFGIVICRDSTFVEPARTMASRGATALFVPTNNGLPPAKASRNLTALARSDDIVRAVENGISVVRADVAGASGDLMSYGSSGIVAAGGTVLGAAQPMEPGLVIAEIETAPRACRHGRRCATLGSTFAARRAGR